MSDSGASQDLMFQMLGRYQVLRRLGKGGMGDVWLCSDPVLRRQVAVKTLPSHSQSDRAYALRFEREAQAAAALNHPHILPVHDYGQQQRSDGQVITYIVMPYVSGGSLKERIELYAAQGIFMPVQESLPYLQQAAQAIDYAHEHGLIHRDIKPANMLLRQDNWLLLADFGIARLLSSTGNLTQTGEGFGTPHYMAPEQAQGRPEFASDTYSLAVIAYYLFTQHFPFDADTDYAITIQALTMDVPPPQRFNPMLTPAFAAALTQGLAKQPEQRPPTARAFVESLQRVWKSAPFDFTHLPIPSSSYNTSTAGSPYNTANSGQSAVPTLTPARPVMGNNEMTAPKQQGQEATNGSAGRKAGLSRRQLLIGGGVAAVVVVGGGLGALSYLQPASSATHTGTTITPTAPPTTIPQNQPLVLLGHNQPVASLAWSPNGMLASAGSKSDGYVMLWDVASLYQQKSSSPKAKASQQFNTASDMLLAWSPKGDMLAIANAGISNDGNDSAILAVYNGDLSSYAPDFNDKFVFENVKSISALAWAPSNYFFTISDQFLATNGKGSLMVWNPSRPEKRIAKFDLNHALDTAASSSVTLNPLAIAAHTAPVRLALGTNDGLVIDTINLSAKTPIFQGGHPLTKDQNNSLLVNNAQAVAWSSDGQNVATIQDALNQPTNITVCNFANNNFSTPSLPNDTSTYLTAITWNPAAGSTQLAGACNDGTVHIWDTAKNALPVDQKSPPASVLSAVRALAWSADGQYLAAAYNDTNASIVVWHK
jgi:Serine/threonine protein kinase